MATGGEVRALREGPLKAETCPWQQEEYAKWHRLHSESPHRGGQGLEGMDLSSSGVPELRIHVWTACGCGPAKSTNIRNTCGTMHRSAYHNTSEDTQSTLRESKLAMSSLMYTKQTKLSEAGRTCGAANPSPRSGLPIAVRCAG